MENRENPKFGRKVFFLNPTLIIENVIMERLRSLEYEVYKISNYMDCKPVLSEYEDSICFINIDDQLTERQWFNFIKSFEFDSSFESIFLGVISAKVKPSTKEQFLLKAKLPGGFTNISNNIDEAYLTIKKILDINGAMGLRKFVRYDCSGHEDVTANCFYKDLLIQFEVDDLSTAGFAVRVQKNFAHFFLVGKEYPINLTIGRKPLVVAVSVFALKENEADTTIVFMFTNETILHEKASIRKFICISLQKNMETFISASMRDMTNYSIKIEPPADSEIKPSLDDLDYTEINDLEDISADN